MKQITILDGGMGTMLQAMGAPMGKVPEELNVTHPKLLKQIHHSYIESGADILYANTFSANRYKLRGSQYTVAELVSAGIRNAREAAGEAAGSSRENSFARDDGGQQTQGEEVAARRIRVALDIGPVGKLLEPNGDLKFEEAYEIFREMLEAGEAAGADLVVFETMTDLLEIKAAVLAAKEHTSLPIYATMSFEKNGRTFTGVTVAAAAITLTALGVDALGINCSLGPAEILPMAEEMLQYTHLPVIVKPNAGLPNLMTQQYDLVPEEFAQAMGQMLEKGVRIVGGCCGTTPEYIQRLQEVCADWEEKASEEIPSARQAASWLCSANQVVEINGVRVVGERINPTGKKLFKEALRNHNLGYILNQALEQVQAGAQILDVNVGLPEIDEKQMMVDVIKELQGILDVPLQIDSTNPEVLEAALRIYNGKPLVNSVNGERAVMDRILPLVKKYGAAVIGLTLDESGIPDKAEDRVAIAEKIVRTAEGYGIAREDIYIDCLTMTASVKQAEVAETLKAVSLVKERLGVKTLLGVSNISFGLPNRELINTAFLTMALEHGLDLPIMNPNNAAMMGAVDAYRVLCSEDSGAQAYVEKYHGQVVETKLAAKNAGSTGGVQKGQSADHMDSASKVQGIFGAVTDVKQGINGSESLAEGLRYAVLKGIKDHAGEDARALLREQEPLELVNGILIPALDQVGTEFEEGRLFLPQLLQSAGAAQAAFEVIKQYMASQSKQEGSGKAAISKGRIILATVKGDIHDIGKNIVKVVLENYGYDVIDLGKDVPVETVVEAAKKTGAPLVGLSALMTTTVVNMEATIQAIREAGLECKIMVGGAVLTPEYAEKIGADYYARDAKQSADIAKEVFGGLEAC